MAREQAKFFWDAAWGPQPFTPLANTGQGLAFTAASPASAQVSAPAVPHLATEIATSSVPVVSQSALLTVSASVVTAPGGTVTAGNGGLTSGGLTSASSGDTSGASASDSAGAAGALFASLPDDGWFIVPSAANEYGQAYAAGDGFVWDVATGEFAADWFFV
jgi:hypothetical protein